MRSIFTLSALVLCAVACGSDAAPSSGGSSQKKAGDACTCTYESTPFGPQGPLTGCSGTASGCFSTALSCQLARGINMGETGSGTCVQTCTRADEGKQGTCPAGTTCSASSAGALLCQ